MKALARLLRRFLGSEASATDAGVESRLHALEVECRDFKARIAAIEDDLRWFIQDESQSKPEN